MKNILNGKGIFSENNISVGAFNNEVDIVFAEANMKRMNGLQLIQFVRHEHPDVKSFLIETDEEISDSFLVIPEDVTGVLI